MPDWMTGTGSVPHDVLQPGRHHLCDHHQKPAHGLQQILPSLPFRFALQPGSFLELLCDCEHPAKNVSSVQVN